VSNAEYLVHLERVNRLCACREFCGACAYLVGNLNGTRCRDGVSLVASFPSTLVGF